MFFVDVQSGDKISPHEAIQESTGVIERTTGKPLQIAILRWNRVGRFTNTSLGYQDTTIVFLPGDAEPIVTHGEAGRGSIKWEPVLGRNYLLGRLAITKHNMNMLAAHFYQDFPNTSTYHLDKSTPNYEGVKKEIKRLADMKNRNRELEYDLQKTPHDIGFSQESVMDAKEKEIAILKRQLMEAKEKASKYSRENLEQKTIGEIRSIARNDYNIHVKNTDNKEALIKKIKDIIERREGEKDAEPADQSSLVENANDSTGNDNVVTEQTTG